MQTSFRFLLFALIFSTALAQAAPEPINLNTIKNDLKNYHDSGAYNSDIARSENQALSYLRFRINQNSRLEHPKKLAIVLDIDETALSNYRDMLRLNFGGTPQEVDQGEGAGHDKAITQTLALYEFAHKKNVAVFFITGRHPDIRQNTIKNLKAVGFKDWAGIYFKPDNYTEKSVVAYKSGMRKKIIDQGYDIVLNIGDQKSDLKGGNADMAFKLPNPFYFIG